MGGGNSITGIPSMPVAYGDQIYGGISQDGINTSVSMPTTVKPQSGPTDHDVYIYLFIRKLLSPLCTNKKVSFKSGVVNKKHKKRGPDGKALL